MAELATVPISKIVVDLRLQVRQSLNAEKVEEYAQRMKDGAHFPPIHCGYVDGEDTLYVVDGFHRLEACASAEIWDIEVETKTYSTFDDMYEYAFRANNIHGINLTDEEIREGIIRIIKMHPEESQRKLAERCGCGRTTIQRYQNQLAQVGQFERPEKTIGKDGKERPATRNTGQTSPTQFCAREGCGVPIWEENKGDPNYTYTERNGLWFCSEECADMYEQERLSDEAEALTGIPDELPETPSAALPVNDEDEPEPVKNEVEPALTEDEENEAIAEDLAFRLKNFRPQRINSILIIFLFKKLKLTLKNITNITTARRSKNDELPEEEKTGFKWKLNDGSEWELSKSDMEDLRPLYPAIDFEQELRKSIGWSLTNPKNRKTKSGILKHINSWLTNAQNKATRSDGHAGRKSGYVSRDAGLDFENLEY